MPNLCKPCDDKDCVVKCIEKATIDCKIKCCEKKYEKLAQLMIGQGLLKSVTEIESKFANIDILAPKFNNLVGLLTTTPNSGLLVDSYPVSFFQPYSWASAALWKSFSPLALDSVSTYGIAWTDTESLTNPSFFAKDAYVFQNDAYPIIFGQSLSEDTLGDPYQLFELGVAATPNVNYLSPALSARYAYNLSNIDALQSIFDAVNLLILTAPTKSSNPVPSYATVQYQQVSPVDVTKTALYTATVAVIYSPIGANSIPYPASFNNDTAVVFVSINSRAIKIIEDGFCDTSC